MGCAGSATMGALLLAVVAVQGQGTTSAPQTGGPVIYTGCVERAEQVMTGGANTLGTSLDSMMFVLIRAREGAGDAVGTSGTGTGATGTPAAAASAAASSPESRVGMIVRLDGDDSALNPHVGKQVRVVGTREATPGTRADARTRAAAVEAPSLATAPIVHVESVAVIAEACSGNR